MPINGPKGSICELEPREKLELKFSREDILCEVNRIRRSLDRVRFRKRDMTNLEHVMEYFTSMEIIRDELYDLEYKIMGKKPRR